MRNNRQDQKDIAVEFRSSADGKIITITLSCEDSRITEAELIEAIVQCMGLDDTDTDPNGGFLN